MVAVNYLWNPINDNIVREFDDAGSVVAEYTTEPDLYGNVVSQFRGGQTNYLHSDALGSTTELTNDAGAVTDAIRYTAFGEVTQRAGTTEIPFQYVGQKGYYRDNETSEYSVRHRPLSAPRGRWSTFDPFVAEVIKALYNYAANSPLVRLDPSGLADEYSISVTRLASHTSKNCDKGTHEFKGFFFRKDDPLDPKRKITIPAKFSEPVAAALYSFALNKEAPCSALFVAKVSVTCDVTDCVMCSCPDKRTAQSFSYVETFQRIEKGGKQSLIEPVTKYLDAASYEIAVPTCGSSSQTVEIRAYCRDKADADMSKLPPDTIFIGQELQDDLSKKNQKGWAAPRKHGSAYCGIGIDNPSFPTDSNPAWWDKNEGFAKIAKRSFEVKFDCCPGKNDITASYEP